MTREASLRVAAFTGGQTISSRRFRVMQYLQPLAALGVDVHENIARFGSWPPPQTWRRPFWLAATLVDRVAPLLRSHTYDLSLFQRELVSTLCTLERFSGRPRVLDVDDAVWLSNRRAFNSFSRLARQCDAVMCGNQYIADAVQPWNARTLILPTAVDTVRFSPAAHRPSGRAVIGWSGLHAGAKYLLGIEQALFKVLSQRPDAVLRVVSDARPAFRWLTDSMVEYIRWSPENEVKTIQEMTVGLMPIDDTEWSRGKCSYKMLLYMACGVPVVVSPFGMNNEVLAHGDVGMGALGTDDWTDKINWLLDHPDQARAMGANGSQVVADHYSLASLAPRMADFLREVAALPSAPSIATP